jgi:hypothetical protein
VTTTTVYASAADGRIESDSPTYATARAGNNLVASAANTTDVHGQWEFFNRRCYEAFLSFDTSGIPDGDTVSAATLDLYGQNDGSTTDFVSEARTKDWGASLTTADWVAGADLGSLTLQASRNTSAGWSTSAYNTYTSEAGFPAAVNKTGTTYLMMSSSRHRIGNDPGASGSEKVDAYSADDSGTTRDPKLTVVHAGAAQDTPELAGRPFGQHGQSQMHQLLAQ